MKLVGFIKEYDNIEDALPFHQMVYGSRLHPGVVRDRLNRYMAAGQKVFAWMSFCSDLETGESICPNAYYTDGVWVWPAYFKYYLEVSNSIYVAPEFLTYLENRDFMFEAPDEFGPVVANIQQQLLRYLTAQQ